MQEEPDASYLESILDAISDSRSAFEQGQALTAALQIAPLLGPPGKAQLAEAVSDQLVSRRTGTLPGQLNRRRVAEQLLGALNEEATPPSFIYLLGGKRGRYGWKRVAAEPAQLPADELERELARLREISRAQELPDNGGRGQERRAGCCYRAITAQASTAKWPSKFARSRRDR